MEIIYVETHKQWDVLEERVARTQSDQKYSKLKRRRKYTC